MSDEALESAQVVERAGTRLHYWLSGPDTGPLVIFSHGASMDHCLFDAQINAVTEAGYRMLTWDMRGHGYSKPLGGAPLTTQALADDLVALLDVVGYREPACLVGQSLGGYVSQEVVFKYPDRVATLVVVGATCATIPLRRWERWALKTSPWWFRVWPDGHLRKLIATSTALTRDAQRYAYEATRLLTKSEFVAVWTAVTQAIHAEPGYRIEHPLLLCHGDQDTTGNVAKSAPAWAARDPQCQYEVIPKARHNANHDNPEAFNALLLDFLRVHYPIK